MICNNASERKMLSKTLFPAKLFMLMSASVYFQRRYPRCKTLDAHCSRKVNRFVCRILIALSASRSSITQDMLISLAPVIMLVSLAMPVCVI
jgi:hypothetical protein